MTAPAQPRQRLDVALSNAASAGPAPRPSACFWRPRPGQPTTRHKTRRARAPGDRIELQSEEPYVSRGGLKLEHGLQVFGLAVRGCTALDLGAATAGSPTASSRLAPPRSTPSTSAMAS